MSTVERTPDALRAQETTGTPPRVSVVIPCLNEAQTIEECVRRARAALDAAGVSGEVVVADNGSDDGSAELAEAAGAHVVREPRPDRDDPHPRHARIVPARPLAQREVGDLMAVRGEALGEVAVPALGPADGVGEQAVVDEADPQGLNHSGRRTDTSHVQP